MKRKSKRHYYKDQELLIEIGGKLRSAREAKGLGQESFANDIGVDYSQINRMELGKVNFTISNLYRIARELKIDAKELLP